MGNTPPEYPTPQPNTTGTHEGCPTQIPKQHIWPILAFRRSGIGFLRRLISTTPDPSFFE